MQNSGERPVPIVNSYLPREKEMYELASEIQGLSVWSLTIAAYPSVATTWLPDRKRLNCMFLSDRIFKSEIIERFSLFWSFQKKYGTGITRY